MDSGRSRWSVCQGIFTAQRVSLMTPQTHRSPAGPFCRNGRSAKPNMSSCGNTSQTPERSWSTAKFYAICCDLRRSGRGRPRSPARQAGPTDSGRHSSTSILPEWTFGEAEPSSQGNPRENTAAWAICCDSRRTGRGRPRSPARQAGPTSIVAIRLREFHRD